MIGEILSIAVFEPHEGKEEETVNLVHGLIALLREKRYSRDVLYHDKQSRRLMIVRHWTSEQARGEAHEDPDVHGFWARLGHLVKTEKIYESYEQVD
jgi:quinol monooxygenase YgiN